MKLSEMREKTVDELKQFVEDSKKQLLNFRIQKSMHKLENTAEISKTKRLVAQAKTVIAENDFLTSDLQKTMNLVNVNDWKDKKVVYDSWHDEFVEEKQPTDLDFHKAEIMYMEEKSDYMKDWKDLDHKMQLDYLKENVMEDNDPDQYITYNDYKDLMNVMEESFERTWKTEHGDIVHVLGYMGHD